jgi:hypothetical protein
MTSLVRGSNRPFAVIHEHRVSRAIFKASIDLRVSDAPQRILYEFAEKVEVVNDGRRIRGVPRPPHTLLRTFYASKPEVANSPAMVSFDMREACPIPLRTTLSMQLQPVPKGCYEILPKVPQ